MTKLIKQVLLLFAILLPTLTFGQISDTFSQVDVTKWICYHPDQQPQFKGEVYRFLAKNIRYPADARKNRITGKVILSFIVENDGNISNIKVVKGIGFGCEEEVIRVCRKMPKWKPGIKDGIPVRVYIEFPVSFSLQ